MEMGFTALIAAIGGGALTLVMFGHILFSNLAPQMRVRSDAAHVLEVSYRGQVISINLNEIDREDPAKLDNMIAALSARREEGSPAPDLEHA